MVKENSPLGLAVDPVSNQVSNQAQYDAIVFDFDGVLVESVDVKTEAFGALYAEYGDRIVEQVRAYHILHGGVSRFVKFRYYHEVLLGKTLTKEEEHYLGERFSQCVEDAVVAAKYVMGAYEFLENNYQSIPLFVASGTPELELQRIVARRNMSHYFLSVHGSPASKGDIIQNILQKYNFDRDRVLMVGDSLSDYEGAIAAGVKFIGRVLQYPSTVPFTADTIVLPDLCKLAV
ncbi:HAD family hydrolase [Pseudanabaena sp. UWO310]|nr:HAD family hydrolase [Pseudanabaena sp. UWO310]